MWTFPGSCQGTPDLLGFSKMSGKRPFFNGLLRWYRPKHSVRLLEAWSRNTSPPAFRSAAAEGIPRTEAADAASTCQRCSGPLSGAEAEFCRERSAKFSGRLLCRACQKQSASVQRTPAAQPEPLEVPRGSTAKCDNCGNEVERKVVLFCRYNSKRYGGRILCRNCQETAT